MAKISSTDLLDAFKEMTLLELSDFVKQFEETFDVTAAAPVAVAAAPAAGGGGGGDEAAAEQDEFDVILEAAGDKKIQVIKEVRTPDLARPQGGQGPGRQRAEAGPGEGRQGRRREGQGRSRGRRRHRHRQVKDPSLGLPAGSRRELVSGGGQGSFQSEALSPRREPGTHEGPQGPIHSIGGSAPAAFIRPGDRCRRPRATRSSTSACQQVNDAQDTATVVVFGEYVVKSVNTGEQAAPQGSECTVTADGAQSCTQTVQVRIIKVDGDWKISELTLLTTS